MAMHPSLSSAGRPLRAALVIFLALSLLVGLLYPLATTGVARLLWPFQAGGSLLEQDGRVVGSALIGQSFSDPRYFWGRPSATAPMPYNAAASGGSNLGPSNPVLAQAVQARIAALRAADPANPAPIPVDLATASGSGLDPHISPAAASYQAARVARARGLPAATVEQLIARHTERPAPDILGEPVVNVLALNLALDRLR
ncbi:potassium-transporting ATPase subunit KdpC [Bordetella bronchiseptica]|uniref:potassium-transporting ATPase subunit KdpC n=1 Tax=Bordetella bronchiseptica TaxID=518 RepID=UPI00081D1E6F|nr:potassium-transporting ATPase subunit KdpC [Bordetella bronchiseptica]AOB28067.1 K+-transporting ATPase subunit C [Bordetella bronchiseptica]AZW45403.1 potassium-transporting ATPase subunit KdpC [Bordetella bronchiseptica]